MRKEKTMKHALSLLLALLFALSLLLVGCNGTTTPPEGPPSEDDPAPSELSVLMDRIGSADGYTAEMRFTWADGSEDTVTHKRDGNATYTSAFRGAPEQYTETVSDVLYVYNTETESWEYADDVDDADSFAAFFNAASYGDKNALGRYPMSANKTPAGYENVTLTIIDEGCVIFCDIVRGTERAALTLRITHIGDTAITLPD